jgi:putative oxygen-independent coproporphyrinogen III oxidase
MNAHSPIPGGIYVHLPYCVSRCEYCAFVVTTDESSRTRYLDALIRECELVAPEAARASFDSIYLGGGTPSRVPAGEISRLLGQLRACFQVEASAEVTLEANPDDVTQDLARAWRACGITRVSAGVQSFEDRELSAVGRRHDAATARRALGLLTQEDFSVSADLILGLPEQTPETFEASVEQLLDSRIPHVSIYLLETEKSKAIEQDRRVRPERYLSDDAQAELWLSVAERLQRAGYVHYEVSNWSIPGREARHNCKYWQRVSTLGFGVSAHELWGGRRRGNVSALPGYFSAIEAGRRPTALDQPIDEEEAARERIVLGLRLAQGIAWSDIEAWLESHPDSALEEDLASWQSEGLAARSNGRLQLTERGFLVSNEILCRFI